MKRFFSVLFAICMLCSLVSPAYVMESTSMCQKGTIDFSNIEDDPSVSMSEPMSFEEMVQRYADNAGITYVEALKAFPDVPVAHSTRDYQNRVFSVTLNVTSTYKPHIEFYCVTAEGGSFRDIKSIYSVQLVRTYNSVTKQFSGTLEFWLRSRNSIEYVINGDFLNDGITTDNWSGGLEFGIDEGGRINFSFSGSTSAGNFYRYFYEHKTPAFFP